MNTFLADDRFSIERDRGLSEVYEYLKTVFCVVGLAACYKMTSQPVYAALSSIFVWVLLDNAFGLHEYLGAMAAGSFDTAHRLFASAPQAFGEVTVFAGLGLIIAVTMSTAYRRSGPEHRALAGVCLGTIVVLAGFGVGVDMLHAMVAGWAWFDRAVGTIEDGG
ncbi:MAG: hypothetical protein H7Z10_02510, partial [Gemmatimonadaceae bacterium]|nr:hypothetical protein [Acetobacteraceae bacterium]